jgi:hypothetical protein
MPNKTEFQNKIVKIQVEIMDGYVEQLRSGSLWNDYNREIQKLATSGATIQDRAEFEINFVKRDIDKLAQTYFSNYINYFEYLAYLLNICNVWSLVRHNWDVQHPMKHEEEVVKEDMVGTTESQT